MDRKKKWAGWLVLTVIVVVAAVALAVTNIATEGPISQRNLGQAQAALEGMFPEADPGGNGFESLEGDDPNGPAFSYAVVKDGQVIGYAFKETVQGYAGPIELIAGLNNGLSLRGLNVGGSSFQETEGLGAKAKDPAFTDQFKNQTPPLMLGNGIEAISGATITSRAVVEGVNNGVSKLQARIADGGSGTIGSGTGGADNALDSSNAGAGGSTDEAGPQGSGGKTANASVIGYGGPVLVRLSLDEAGAVSALTVGQTRFAETEGVGSKVKEDTFTRKFVGKTPPLSLSDVEGISGATVSSQAVVDAVNEAYAFLNP